MCRRGVQLSGPVLMVAEDQNEAGRGSAAGGMGSNQDGDHATASWWVRTSADDRPWRVPSDGGLVSASGAPASPLRPGLLRHKLADVTGYPLRSLVCGRTPAAMTRSRWSRAWR
jgi:hypothetical protein